jgi:predicted nucleotidyltransferase
MNERKIHYNKKLSPDIWKNGVLIERIRKKLLNIGKDFFKNLEYDVEIKDIHLTGSMANYNYNANSDLDVHIIIDFKDISNNTELVKKAMNGHKFEWNMKHDITIKGHDVEVYIMDINEDHISSGQFSLMFNKWTHKPKFNPPDIDSEEIDEKYDIYVYYIDRYERLSKKNIQPEDCKLYFRKSRKLMDKIMKNRKSSLKEDGEFAIDNLVFKKLRLNGKIKKLVESINLFYDKIYTQ